MPKLHTYPLRVTWTGNTGSGTRDYRSYERSFEISSGDNKPGIPGSSDPAFRGDRTRWNPEELLVASLSACHKLWYLHLCAEAGVIVTAYVDDAEGEMAENAGGSGQFTRVTLRPRISLAPGADRARAAALHATAHEHCFIARSVNFSVLCEPTFAAATPPA